MCFFVFLLVGVLVNSIAIFTTLLFSFNFDYYWSISIVYYMAYLTSILLISLVSGIISFAKILIFRLFEYLWNVVSPFIPANIRWHSQSHFMLTGELNGYYFHKELSTNVILTIPDAVWDLQLPLPSTHCLGSYIHNEWRDESNTSMFFFLNVAWSSYCHEFIRLFDTSPLVSIIAISYL